MCAAYFDFILFLLSFFVVEIMIVFCSSSSNWPRDLSSLALGVPVPCQVVVFC